MKIIQISASYKPAYVYGGPTMSVSKLCEELVKAGEDLEVICTTANGRDELLVKPGTPIVVDHVPVTYYKRLTKDHSHFSPALYRSLWKKASSKTIVHIQAWWNLVSVFSCLIAVIKDAKTIISPRGTLSSYSFNNRTSWAKKLFHNLIGRRLLRRCHFHVTSEKEKQDIANLINPKSITVIPNFVRLPEKSESLKKTIQKGDPLKFLFLSRLEEKKGLELIFACLSKVNCNWTLTIAGSGTDSYITELKKLANKLNLEDKIHWLGHLDNNVKFKAMASHHLMILPSFDENFANVVIECLAVGTPVLITSNVGLSDYVFKNRLGWICDRTESSILITLKEIMDNPDLINNISDSAPGVIYQDFKEQNIIKLYQNLYRSLNK